MGFWKFEAPLHPGGWPFIKKHDLEKNRPPRLGKVRRVATDFAFDNNLATMNTAQQHQQQRSPSDMLPQNEYAYEGDIFEVLGQKETRQTMKGVKYAQMLWKHLATDKNVRVTVFNVDTFPWREAKAKKQHIIVKRLRVNPKDTTRYSMDAGHSQYTFFDASGAEPMEYNSEDEYTF